MAKKVSLSVNDYEARLLYEALSFYSTMQRKSVVRVSGSRAPFFDGKADTIDDIQRRLAPKISPRKQ